MNLHPPEGFSKKWFGGLRLAAAMDADAEFPARSYKGEVVESGRFHTGGAGPP